MSLTDREVEQLLRSMFPGRTFDWLEAEEDDGGIGDLLLALAEEANADGFELVDQLAKEVIPSTAEQSLPEREASMGLDASRIALYGTTAQRQAQLVTRWRSRGTPTQARVLAGVRAITGPLTGEIIEMDRAVLTAANWYEIGGLPLAIPPSADLDMTFAVTGESVVTTAGARVTVRITHPSVEDLTLKIIAPDATESSVYTFGSGSVTGRDFIFYWQGASGLDIEGTWTVRITDGGASGGTVDDPAADGVTGLHVEDANRASFAGPSGKAAPIWEWSVAVNEAYVLASTYDRAVLLALVREWNPAGYNGGVALYMTDGTLCALADDANAIADLCVAC